MYAISLILIFIFYPFSSFNNVRVPTDSTLFCFFSSSFLFSSSFPSSFLLSSLLVLLHFLLAQSERETRVEMREIWVLTERERGGR
jgi:hypothetical protein